MTLARRFVLAAVAIYGGSLGLSIRESRTPPLRLPGAWTISVGASRAAAAEPDLAEPEAPAMDPVPPEPAPPEIASELAALRTEIAELRRQILRRPAPAGGNPFGAGASPPTAPVTPASPFLPDARVGIVVASLVSLAVGWISGAFFVRRRGRSQRNRLRF